MSKIKDNANDAMVGSANWTPEELEARKASFNLNVYLINMLSREPFYAHILRSLRKVETDKIPTAGVLFKEGEATMWWNRDFVCSLTDDEIIGLLMHEVMHLTFEHTTTRTRDPHVIWNYATDLAINSMIVGENHVNKHMLPKGGLIPGIAFEEPTPEQREQMGDQAYERWKKVSDKIASFPLFESSDWYFAELMSDPEIQQAIQSGQQMQGKSLSQALADGDVKIDENGDLVDKDGNPVTLVPGAGDDTGMDTHEGWGDMSDEDRELMKGKIKEAVEKAVRRADGSNMWGSVGAATREKLRQLISNEIPWQSVLKQFCGTTRRADRASSIRRIHRKYAGIHPGAYRDYKANIAVYLDQSGSVSDSDLEMFAAELQGLSKRVTFTLFNFDTEVDEKSERELRQGRKVELFRTRCGGTDFACVTKHVNGPKGKRFDGALILTDGYAPDPGISRTKLGWVICPTGELQFTKKSRDFLIKMKENKRNV
jgi:predicted metal-dependent peptidase